MKTKLPLLAVLAVALFGAGCATTEPAFVKEGLVAYYPFNGNAKDESGNGNGGEVKGASLAEDRHGVEGEAYSFDGEDDHIYIPSSSILKEMGSVSVSVWVKVNENQKVGSHGYNSFVSRWEGNGPNISFWIGTKDSMHIAASVAPHTGHSPVQKEFNRNAWLHVVYAHDSAGAGLFLDGKRGFYTKHVKMELNEFDEPLLIGAERNGKGVFKCLHGVIDDIRIYNRALSDAEVKALYEWEKSKAK